MWSKVFAHGSWAVIAISAVGLIMLVGAAPNSPQDSPQEDAPRRPPTIEPEQRLSVEETLGAIFDPGIGPVNAKYHARANPDALDAVCQVLDNEELSQFHTKAWQVLGHIGRKKHVRRVEKKIERIKQVSGWLPPKEEGRLRTLFNSLGIMCGREIEEACALAETMMDPAYWKDAKFRLEGSQDPDNLNSVNDTIMWVVIGYALSLDPDIDQLVQSILKKIDDPKQREMLEGYIRSEIRLRSARNVRADERGKVTPEERENLASYFNGDLQNPGPAR